MRIVSWQKELAGIHALAPEDRQLIRKAANCPEDAAGRPLLGELRDIATAAKVCYRSTGRLKPHALRLLRA